MPESTTTMVSRSLSQNSINILALSAQFLLCMVVLSVVCERLQKMSLFYSRTVIILAFFVGAVLKNISNIPQIYFDQVSSFVIKSSEFLLIFGATLFILVPFMLLRNGRVFDYTKLLGFSCLVIILFFTNIDFSTTPKLYKSSTNSILILSIDSMRPDLVHDFVHRYPKSEIASLLSGSVEFLNIITPIAKTHPSITSFLTGLNPEDHEVRDNLFSKAFENDSTFSKSQLLNQLTKMNYKKSLILDEVKFGTIRKGAVFDNVISPTYEFIDLLVTELFRPTLYWGFFSNSFGDNILRKAKMNASYSQNYRTDHFLGEIIEALNSPEENKFIFAHTCALHNPTSTTTAYLGKKQKNKENLFTRYPNYFNLKANEDNTHLIELKKLAEEKFEQIMFELVEPLLKLLKESNRLESMTFVLTSDHGETFYTGPFGYNQIPMPYHGNPALFDEDSFRAFALIKSPKYKSEKVSEIQSLIDIHDYLLGLVKTTNMKPQKLIMNEGRFRYFESSVVDRGLLSSELSLSQNFLLEGLFINSLGGMQVVDAYVHPLIIQKTRSLMTDIEHYSFVPTYYGIESVACVIPVCRSFKKTQMSLDSISHQLNLFTKKDQFNGLYPKATNLIHKSGDLKFELSDSRPTNPAISWLVSAQNLNQKGQLKSFLDFWLLIKKSSTSLPMEIDNYMNFFLDRVCLHEKIHNACEIKTAIRQEVNDAKIITELNTVLRTSDQTKIRKFIKSNSSNLMGLKNMRYKFLSLLSSEIVSSEAERDKEIEDIKSLSNRVIDSHLFEVDSEWLVFLYIYSKIVNADVFTSEVVKFVRENRIPFLTLTGFVFEKTFYSENQECYYEKVYPSLMKKILNNDFPNYPEDMYKYIKNDKTCQTR